MPEYAMSEQGSLSEAADRLSRGVSLLRAAVNGIDLPLERLQGGLGEEEDTVSAALVALGEVQQYFESLQGEMEDLASGGPNARVWPPIIDGLRNFVSTDPRCQMLSKEYGTEELILRAIVDSALEAQLDIVREDGDGVEKCLRAELERLEAANKQRKNDMNRRRPNLCAAVEDEIVERAEEIKRARAGKNASAV